MRFPPFLARVSPEVKLELADEVGGGKWRDEHVALLATIGWAGSIFSGRRSIARTGALSLPKVTGRLLPVT